MKKLPLFSAAAGLAAALLHLGISGFAFDRKGLLVPTHPLCILLWILSALVAGLFLLKVLPMKDSCSYGHNFAPSIPAAAGILSLALGIAATVFFSRFSTSPLELARNIAGLVCIPCLVWAAICRREGRQPFFLLQGVVCLFLILHAIVRYQTWSSQSQILTFFFPMAGCLLSALFAYHQTAFTVGMGKRRSQIYTGLAGGFFCFGAVAANQDPVLYLAAGLWMLTNLCALNQSVTTSRKDDTP